MMNDHHLGGRAGDIPAHVPFEKTKRSPPWNRQRRFPGTTLMMHGAPALVLAQHLGRNLRFKGSPLCDRPRSNILRRQCRS
jgi:hypothetical protein